MKVIHIIHKSVERKNNVVYIFFVILWISLFFLYLVMHLFVDKYVNNRWKTFFL